MNSILYPINAENNGYPPREHGISAYDDGRLKKIGEHRDLNSIRYLNINFDRGVIFEIKTIPFNLHGSKMPLEKG